MFVAAPPEPEQVAHLSVEDAILAYHRADPSTTDSAIAEALLPRLTLAQRDELVERFFVQVVHYVLSGTQRELRALRAGLGRAIPSNGSWVSALASMLDLTIRYQTAGGIRRCCLGDATLEQLESYVAICETEVEQAQARLNVARLAVQARRSTGQRSLREYLADEQPAAA